MSERNELKISAKGPGGKELERPPMTWRQTLLGGGMFTLVIALFVGAAMKESGALVTKILGGAGLAMMAVGIVGVIIDAIASKLKGREREPVGTVSES